MVQAVAEATRSVIQAMAVAGANRTQNVGPKLGRPIMKQLSFNWCSPDKYAEMKNFKLKVKYKFQNYSMSQAERVSIINNWLERQGLQLLKSLI